jgi:hypothetical protein
MSLVDVKRLREIAEVEFADIVVEVFIPDVNELRVILTDRTFILTREWTANLLGRQGIPRNSPRLFGPRRLASPC